MRKVMLSLMIATGSLVSTMVHAEDPLEGFELDLVTPTESPSQEITRIALPEKANARAQERSSFGTSQANAAKEHEPGREFGQSTSEQARTQHGNSGQADSRRPDSAGSPEASQRPDSAGRPDTSGKPDTAGRPESPGSAAGDNRPTGD